MYEQLQQDEENKAKGEIISWKVKVGLVLVGVVVSFVLFFYIDHRVHTL